METIEKMESTVIETETTESNEVVETPVIVEDENVVALSKYGVYAKINEDKFVTRVYSTCFEEKEEGDVLVKEGNGDEFVHVGYYHIYDENGLFNYMLDGEEVVEVTEEQKETTLAKIHEEYNLAHLDEEKAKKIEVSKVELEKWLAENPIEISIKGTEGEKYSVTKEKQDELLKMIATIDVAEKMSLEFTPTWNQTGQLCEEYSAEELDKLSIAMMTYVYPKIEMQRVFELEILKVENLEDLEKIVIDYK